MRILLAIPTRSAVHACTCAWAARVAHTPGVEFAAVIGRPEDYARNSICRVAIEHGYDHVMMVDSDVEPPLDALDRLLAADAPVATGVYPVLMGSGPRWALARRGEDGAFRLLAELDSVSENFEVDGSGAGCLLIRRDVLERIEWPWFRWEEWANGHQVGEDLYFGRKCLEAGIRTTVAPTVLCRHRKEIDLLALMRRGASDDVDQT